MENFIENRPKRTLLDCDGVLADWTSFLLKTLDVGLTIDDCYDFKLRRVLTDLRGKHVAKQADIICSRNEFTESQPLLPWARELIDILMIEGHVTILTSPWSSKGWYDARIKWLNANLGIRQDDVIVGRLKNWVTADLFVDDKPSNIIEWANDNPQGRAVLLAWPYNANHTALPPNAKRMTPDELLNILRRFSNNG
jgi:5'(3')-deoxyribonucleotidase